MAPPSRNGGLLERRRATRLSLVALFAAGVVGAGWMLTHRAQASAAAIIPGEGEHTLVVEVLNGTDLDGLAREVARRLRAQGIDVVYFGSGDRRDLDATRIVVRKGDTTVAGPIRDALGTGRVTVELDPRLLIDASIIVGRDLSPSGALENRRP